MPRAKEGHKIVTVVVPDDVVAKLEALAERLNWSFTEVAVHAFERHTRTPPVPVDVPPLPPETANVKPPPPQKPKRPRGRPKGSGKKKEGQQ